MTAPLATPSDGHPCIKAGRYVINLHHRRGKLHTMVMMLEGGLDQMSMEFLYYSYCRNPEGWEFFIPVGTLIAVKLLT